MGKRLLEGFVLLKGKKALQWGSSERVLIGTYAQTSGRIILQPGDYAIERERMKRDKYFIKPAMMHIEWSDQ